MAKRVVASYEMREEFFELVCSGMSVQGAADLLGVSRTEARRWWTASGLVEPTIQFGQSGGLPGVPPLRVPAQRGRDGGDGGDDEPHRQRRALTSEDRAVIAAGLQARWSYARIGAAIGRDKSLVWREVRRNRGPDGSYWAPVAHRAAHEQRRRPKQFKLVQNPRLCRLIEEWMDQGWSPKLIAAVLKADHPHMIMDRVSHETIYQALYVQTRGRLRADLHRQLSLKRRQRKPRGTIDGRGTSIYAKAFTIRDRPAEAEDRAVPGHWESQWCCQAA